jgi:hypothetical protein
VLIELNLERVIFIGTVGCAKTVTIKSSHQRSWISAAASAAPSNNKQ